MAGEAGAVLVVALPQDLNHITSDMVRSCVEARLPEHDEAGVVLDASLLSLITSIGVAALLQIEELTRLRKVPLCITGLQGEGLKFLRMLCLDDRFPRQETVALGVGYVEGAIRAADQ